MRARSPTHSFVHGGQKAWFHDEGYDYGPLHTFDALRLPGIDERPRKIHVLVPHAYGASGERYPVVYLNDGQTAFFPGGPGPHSWRAAEAVGGLVAAGRLEPVIVVAVHPVDRDAEYTHAPWFPGRAWGGLPRYASWVADVLKPWVDATYRTRPARGSTAVVGSSHGGLAAFYTAVVHADRFGFAGALSPSFWVGARSPREATQPLEHSTLLAATAPTLADRSRRPRLWIDWGLNGDGAARGARAMATLLETGFGYVRDRELKVVEDVTAGHDERAWGDRLPEVLAFAFPPA
jgi:hypothetical protein